MPPVKHVLAVRVHVPVKVVCRGVVAHVAVANEGDVGVHCSHGCEEGNVVLHVPWLAAILSKQKENMSEDANARHWQGRAGQGRAGQGRAGQGRNRVADLIANGKVVELPGLGAAHLVAHTAPL